MDWLDELPEKPNPCGCENPSDVIVYVAPFRGKGPSVPFCSRCYLELTNKQGRK